MTNEEKRNNCEKFFEELYKELRNDYNLMESCNNDFSKYLVPAGTESEVTYQTKPEYSFRISDHWKWFANTSKCPNKNYIQCYCTDMPRAKPRIAPNKAGKPIKAISICLFKNNHYEVIYGEYFDRNNFSWNWKESSVENVLKELTK